MNWIGRISPEAVTVDRSSGLDSIFTEVTSGSSLRPAAMLMTTDKIMTNSAMAPIIIFFLRLNAMLLGSFGIRVFGSTKFVKIAEPESPDSRFRARFGFTSDEH